MFVRRTDEEFKLNLFNQNNLQAEKDKTERMAIEDPLPWKNNDVSTRVPEVK